MTQPTKAIAPILLEDMRKVAVDRKGETNFFTSQMIKDCMKKVVPVGLHQGWMGCGRIRLGSSRGRQSGQKIVTRTSTVGHL